MARRWALRLRLLRTAILFAALLCIGLGIARGEVAVVLNKAVKICLECIGVG